ncbi:MAG: G-D-S-L family lipolytic protein [Chitinophagaceae bacterium]|nr:MAG: G-D-S-L family lipolytic protein [Chitinophagaceae bacterium]
MKKGLLILVLLWAVQASAQEEQPAFWDDVQAFRKQDSIAQPPSKAILFIGSSSFTMWKNPQQDFPGSTIINRAFGGSTLLDQLRYVKDIVYPYNAKQIVIYCGENDIASSDTISAATVANRFYELFQLIRKKLPKAQVTFISMKPSPSREFALPRLRAANDMIRTFLATKKRTTYVDVYKEMITDEGKPRPELFLTDNLHMNRAGYDIWIRLMQPYLLK